MLERGRFATHTLVIIAAFTVALLALHYQFEGVYPTGLVVVGLGVGSIFALGATGRVSYVTALAGICLVSGVYRAVITGIPGGVFAPDPTWYVNQVELVNETGHTDVVESGFYSQVPVFIVLITVVENLLGIQPETALVVFSGTVSVLLPLFSSLIGWRLATDNATFAGLATAAIVAVGWHSVYFSYYTIPQTLATVLLLVMLFLLYARPSSGRKQDLLTLVLLGALLYVHKVSLVYAGVLVLGYLLIRAYERGSVRQAALSLVLVGLLFAVQFVFVTTGVERIITRVGPGIMALLGDASTTDLPAPTHAVNPSQRSLPVRVWHNLNFIVLSAAAMLSWLALAYWHRSERTHQIVLLLSALLVGFGAAALVLGITPVRFFFFAELAMAVVIGVALAQSRFSRPSSRRVAVGLVGLILLSQLAVVGAVPDDPRTADRFLSPSEDASLEQAEHHPNVTSEYIYSRIGGFRSIDDTFLNGHVPTDEVDTVAYRTDQGLHRSAPYSGDWQLLWDPQQQLETDCSRTFANDGVVYYRCHS